MEPISVAGQALLSAASTPVAVPAAAPSLLAQQQFNAVMAAGALQPAASAGVQMPVPVAGSSPATLGERILDGVQRTSAELGGRWQSIGESLQAGTGPAGSPPGVADMLQIQFGLSMVMVQYELLGKVVAKTTQNIDTLTRIQ